jgi:tetrahydromethanopterin S-methyltransferase subunit E
MPCSDIRCSTGRDAYRRIADLPVCTVLQKDFRVLEGAQMNIFLSIIGTAIVTILIAGAYSIGVSVGRAAAEEDNKEPVIYMDHTHGGE